MKELKDFLKVVAQSPEVILFEVEPENQINLIANGFDGSERLFRITKMPATHGNFSYTYSSFSGDNLKQGDIYSWGCYGTTCGSADWVYQRNKIRNLARTYGFTS